MSARKPRERIEPTHEWQQLLPLFWWPEQVEYERIRQPVLFGSSVAERAEETGVSERTLRRRIERFEKEGVEGLFGAEAARRRRLPPNIRRLIVDLKAEYAPFNLNEIANIVRVCFGRKIDVRSVKRVLDEEARPLKLHRSYPRFHEMDAYERRAAVVELRLDGWSSKAIAGYLGVHRVTVYRILRRFREEGAESLGDRPRGRPTGVRKVDLQTIEEVRKLAQNPKLGAFRVYAALKQRGFELSRATCGRILAQVREIYGYEKPSSGGGSKKEMPFASSRHHEYWTADVRARLSYAQRGARDNPWIESFWGRFETENGELILEAETLEEVSKIVEAQLEYYNHKRRHSALDYRRPYEVMLEAITGEDTLPEL